MPVTLATTPGYPVPNRKLAVQFSATQGNYVRLFITDAPEGSEFRNELDELAATQIQKHEGPVTVPYEFTPDRPGRYLFSAHEIQRDATSYGGAYEGDPAGFPSDTLIGTETVTVVVGSRMTFLANTGRDAVTLVLYVFDDTIRATTFEEHGEISPELISPTTDAARIAANGANIVTDLAALKDKTISAAIGNLTTIIDEFLDKWGTHIASATIHSVADADNTIDGSWASPQTRKAITDVASEIHRKVYRHLRNDTGDGIVGGGSYHSAADWANATLVESGGYPGAIMKLADVISIADGRGIESGHGLTAVHATPTDVDLIYNSLLLDLLATWLTYLRKQTPTAPATENTGKVLLAQQMGFVEDPIPVLTAGRRALQPTVIPPLRRNLTPPARKDPKTGRIGKGSFS